MRIFLSWLLIIFSIPLVMILFYPGALQYIENLTRHIQETGGHRIIIVILIFIVADWVRLRWKKIKKWTEVD